MNWDAFCIVQESVAERELWSQQNMLCNDRCNYKVVKWLKPSERFYCIFVEIFYAIYSRGKYFSLLADWADVSYGRFLSSVSLWENPQHTWDIFQFSSVSMASSEGCARGQRWILNNLHADRLAICICCYCCCLSICKEQVFRAHFARWEMAKTVHWPVLHVSVSFYLWVGFKTEGLCSCRPF